MALGSASPMPARLRPTAAIATDAVLVGDPGRALLLAQELLEQPKMSNHARGLWGYSGTTPAGDALTVQSTGMGGPSAALVLADLAELGVTRAVRVGTCTALGPEPRPGALLIVAEAHPRPGSAEGGAVLPDPALSAALADALGSAVGHAPVASLDTLPQPADETIPGEVADMQTATLLSSGPRLGVAVAALLIVTETLPGERLDDEAAEVAAKLGGRAAAAVLSG
jgi:purine-nucleoside phosphorylase